MCHRREAQSCLLNSPSSCGECLLASSDRPEHRMWLKSSVLRVHLWPESISKCAWFETQAGSHFSLVCAFSKLAIQPKTNGSPFLSSRSSVWFAAFVFYVRTSLSDDRSINPLDPSSLMTNPFTYISVFRLSSRNAIQNRDNCSNQIDRPKKRKKKQENFTSNSFQCSHIWTNFA